MRNGIDSALGITTIDRIMREFMWIAQDEVADLTRPKLRDWCQFFRVVEPESDRDQKDDFALRFKQNIILSI